MTDQQKSMPQVIVQERDDTDVGINLSELFYRLIEKWFAIALCAALGAVLAAVYTFGFITPMYEATSKLYVMNAGDSAINLSDLQVGSYLANDYKEVFKAWEVHEQVIQNLGLNYSYGALQEMLKITNPSDTRILYITVTSENPNEAMNIANEYLTVARKYITDTMDTEEPRDFSLALLPTKPVKPNKTLNLLLGIVLGGFLSVAAVIVRFILDDKVRIADDIQKYAGIPTFAVVPVLKSSKKSNNMSKGSRG